MKIVGYSDPLSVAPDDKIRFMVSCELAEYRADIVRLIHGDENPDGPGFKEEQIDTPINRNYPGRVQSLHAGSFVMVPDSPLLRALEGITLMAWIYPTTPQKGLQGILTKWSSAARVGYGLFLAEDGSLALCLGDQSGHIVKLNTGRQLRGSEWYFVAATYDQCNQHAVLIQEPLTSWPDDETRVVQEYDTDHLMIGASDVPFLIAGYWKNEEGEETTVHGHFNGKIEAPKVFGKALNRTEIETCADGDDLADSTESLIAAWDFTRHFATASVTDISTHGLHGHAVNMPTRAVTGHNWQGKTMDFKNAPGEYGALYFHDDDLEDAGWEADFELTVPEHMKSGVYAARLRSGDFEDYIPFFVRPRRGTHSAPIAFLVPTATYIAYANNHTLANPTQPSRIRRAAQLDFPVQAQDKYSIKQNLLSMYDRHNDGSGNCFSSRLRPNVTMRPKYTKQALASGKGAPHLLDADLHLLDWMEVKGHRFDVITDEDLHHEGMTLLEPYRVVITGTHPEYWSERMMDGLEEYLAEGGKLMYLGGNGFYWVISFDPERPHVIEVRRWRGTQAWEADPGEYHHSTTGEIGGLWRFRGRAPQKLVGVGHTSEGSDTSRPYHRMPGSFDPRAAFIFGGISEDEIIGDFGLMMGGAGGFEVDRADAALGTPPHALVLASASGFSDDYQHAVEEILNTNPWEGGTKNPLVRSDLVYFEGPKSGAVFSVGSIAWCSSLSHNHYENNVSRITENVLKKFAYGDDD